MPWMVTAPAISALEIRRGSGPLSSWPGPADTETGRLTRSGHVRVSEWCRSIDRVVGHEPSRRGRPGPSRSGAGGLVPARWCRRWARCAAGLGAALARVAERAAWQGHHEAQHRAVPRAGRDGPVAGRPPHGPTAWAGRDRLRRRGRGRRTGDTGRVRVRSRPPHRRGAVRGSPQRRGHAGARPHGAEHRAVPGHRGGVARAARAARPAGLAGAARGERRHAAGVPQPGRVRLPGPRPQRLRAVDLDGAAHRAGTDGPDPRDRRRLGGHRAGAAVRHRRADRADAAPPDPDRRAGAVPARLAAPERATAGSVRDRARDVAARHRDGGAVRGRAADHRACARPGRGRAGRRPSRARKAGRGARRLAASSAGQRRPPDPVPRRAAGRGLRGRRVRQDGLRQPLQPRAAGSRHRPRRQTRGPLQGLPGLCCRHRPALPDRAVGDPAGTARRGG